MKRPDVMIAKIGAAFHYVPARIDCCFCASMYRIGADPCSEMRTIIDLMLHGY